MHINPHQQVYQKQTRSAPRLAPTESLTCSDGSSRAYQHGHSAIIGDTRCTAGVHTNSDT